MGQYWRLGDTEPDPDAVHRAESQLTELAGLLIRSVGQVSMVRLPDGTIRPADPAIRPPRDWTDPVRARELYDQLRGVPSDVFAHALFRATDHPRRRRNVVLVAIKLGVLDFVAPMVDLLYADQSREIAEDYLNCCLPRLVQAATEWANMRGLRIEYSRTGTSARWGVF